MHIAVTNDDGIDAPGIHALAKAARRFGKVTVIAPDQNRSVSGHGKAIGRPLRLDPRDFPEADAAWATDGSPSDCAAFAGLGFTDEPVDILLSGINPTPNLGSDLTYSGTVMAAMEGSLWGVPAAAFSIDCARVNQNLIDFSAIEEILPIVIKQLTAFKEFWNPVLNVNIPALPWKEIRGIKLTHCGRRTYNDVLIRNKDPFGRPYYWFGGDPPESILDEGTDGKALADGYVSITPIHQDLTEYHLLKLMETREWRKDPENE